MGRLVMLISGIVFHVGIALVIGLVSFAFAMSAGLVLGFVRSDESERVVALARSAGRWLRGRRPEPVQRTPMAGDEQATLQPAATVG